MSGFVPSKFRGLAVVLGLAALFFTFVLARGTSTAASNAASVPSAAKVAIVNIQGAIQATNDGKKEFAALQQRFAPKQAQLKSLNDEIESLKKQLQAVGDKLSDQERAARGNTLSEKQKTLQHNYDDAQSEFQQAEQEVTNRIGAKMLTLLEKYAKENGLTLVLDVSSQTTPVLYASENCNITKDLIDAYNATAPATPKTPGK